MIKHLRLILLLFVSGALLACGNDGGGESTDVTISGARPEGIFDPALTRESSSRLWMSYSSVYSSPVVPPADPPLYHVETRLAYSDNVGSSWQDTGIVNATTAIATLPAPYDHGVWNQEMSRVLNDTGDTVTATPWKLIWHTYIVGYNGTTKTAVALHPNGWIALKQADTPANLAVATASKLFAGSQYNTAWDAVGGAVAYRLDTLFAAGLSTCQYFTEPGMRARSDGVFISLHCIKSAQPGKIVLLHCAHDFSGCDYIGDMLDGSEAALFGGGYVDFSATDLVTVGGNTYLIVTPTTGPAGYRGCLVFRTADLGQSLATLKTTDLIVRTADMAKTPVLQTSVSGIAGTFNGACGYHEDATGSGILLSQHQSTTPRFHITKTGQGI